MLPWLNTLIPGLNGWMVASGMAVMGTLLVASPIIIHLLNKRKFKIVDWAAMDFLLDADKRNRRRVRLENLILLLLRCLAVFLLGLLLARPFIPSGLAAGFLDVAQFEHIVVLDDSLSMQVQSNNQAAFDEAKQRLTDMLKGFVDDRNDDTFTLILSSQPNQRLVNGAKVEGKTVSDLTDTIARLEPTDRTANLGELLLALEQDVKAQPKNVNRVVYLVTDLRQRDWGSENASSTDNDPAQALSRISKAANGAVILDVGNEDYRNLMVTEIRPEGVLAAGVDSRFDVTVANFSAVEARDIVVKFKAGDALALEAPIDRIPAGKTASVPFTFTFSASDERLPDGEYKPIDPVKVLVEVVSTRPAEEDRLLADSTAFFPARVVRGIPTLLVDGDPSATPFRSETTYLRRAMRPIGTEQFGVDYDIVHETEMETTSLAKYRVIFLCNVYRFSPKVLLDLENWVRQGGGLVIMPGDQVDEKAFNKEYFKDGQGLSPLRLENIQGDETREVWALMKIEDAKHPALRVFDGEAELQAQARFFRWWGASAQKEQLGSLVSVPARFNDPGASILMAEKKFGQGRVFMTTIPGDADWHRWVGGTYAIAIQELVRHMAGDVAGSGSLRVGESIVHNVDLSDYKTDAEMRAPKERKTTLQAREPGTNGNGGAAGAAAASPAATDVPRSATTEGAADASLAAGTSSSEPEAHAASQTQWQFLFENTSLRGFYELRLTRNDETEEKLLFALNADPSEGNLQRVDVAALQAALGPTVKILRGDSASALAGAGSQREMWKYILIIAAVVLCGEQLLAWAFGMRR